LDPTLTIPVERPHGQAARHRGQQITAEQATARKRTDRRPLAAPGSAPTRNCAVRPAPPSTLSSAMIDWHTVSKTDPAQKKMASGKSGLFSKNSQA